MALSTFSELKTSIANWLHRSDLTAVIPDLIDLCETKFNRVLRLSTMEVRSTATLDQQYETVPSDFLEMRSIQITGGSGGLLTYINPQQASAWYRTTDTGTPKFYTFVDSTIAFFPPPSGSFDMEMLYYKAIPALSDSQTTNWMLTNHPDVYLYGSLKEAEAYIKNDPRIMTWKQQYEEAMSQVMAADQRSRWSGPMQIRPV
jgi:hypothetical protein